MIRAHQSRFAATCRLIGFSLFQPFRVPKEMPPDRAEA
jgi:hypothetical protein